VQRLLAESLQTAVEKNMDLEKLVDISWYKVLYNKHKPRIKSAGKKLLALAIGIVVGLTAAEAALRVYARHSTSPLFINREKRNFNPLRLWRYLPGEIVYESRCNSLGFYDGQEFAIEKTPGVKRVLAISDSFGCVGVPCRYHAFTKAENLNGKAKRWEIYNMSISDTGPEDYLYLLKKEALQYNPDLFLLGFFAGNDLVVPSYLAKDEFHLTKLLKGLANKLYLLKVTGRLYRIFRSGYIGKKGRRVIDEDTGEKHSRERKEKIIKGEENFTRPPKKIENVHSETWWQDINNETPLYNYTQFISIELECFSLNSIDSNYAYYKRIKKILKKMKKLTGEKFAVVLFPDRYQIDDELFQKIISFKAKSYLPINLAEKHGRNYIYRSIREILAKENIPVIELLEPLKKGREKYGRVYRLNDTHLNYWGNHIAAGEIRSFLENRFEEK